MRTETRHAVIAINRQRNNRDSQARAVREWEGSSPARALLFDAWEPDDNDYRYICNKRFQGEARGGACTCTWMVCVVNLNPAEPHKYMVVPDQQLTAYPRI